MSLNSEPLPAHPMVQALSALLADDADPATVSAQMLHEGFDWQAFISYTGDSLILISVWTRLQALGLDRQMPAEARSLFALAHQANSERNRLISDAFCALARDLNTVGIQPLALKGTACLLSHDYQDLAERLMWDIDVLIRPDELALALPQLAACGYQQRANEFEPEFVGKDLPLRPLDPDDFRNTTTVATVPSIEHPDFGVCVDLHTRLAASEHVDDCWLDALIHTNTQPKVMHDARFALPSPLARFIHNFHHAQIKDRADRFASVDWRHLLDAQAIYQRAGDPALISNATTLLARQGMGAAFGLFMYQLRRFLGSTIPESTTAEPELADHIARFERLWAAPDKVCAQRRRLLWWHRLQRCLPAAQRRHYGNIPRLTRWRKSLLLRWKKLQRSRGE